MFENPLKNNFFKNVFVVKLNRLRGCFTSTPYFRKFVVFRKPEDIALTTDTCANLVWSASSTFAVLTSAFSLVTVLAPSKYFDEPTMLSVVACVDVLTFKAKASNTPLD